MEIPQDKIKNQNQDDKVNVVEMKKSIVILNSADSLFSEIRDRNFNAINPVLSRTAKELQQANDVENIFYEEIYFLILRIFFKAKNRLQSVSEIRLFVEKTLKTYQAKKVSLENRRIIFNYFN